MIARDIMTTEILSIGPDARVPDIARLLATRGISAAPVIDGNGALVGMVSEGDLIGRSGRSGRERESRRDWWLSILAEGEALSAEYLDTLRPEEATARDIMSAPVVTASETTDIAEIARLLESYRIKRVPILRDGRVVGIVSRADLVRAIAAAPDLPAPVHPHGPTGLFVEAISALDARLHTGRTASDSHPAVATPASAANAALTAQRFRDLREKYRHQQMQRREEVEDAAEARQREQVKDLTDHHIDDATWNTLIGHALEAAGRGEKEFLLLRFPSTLCSDGGRAINVPLPNWQRTLRGEAAEIYLRWERELKSHGFHLGARVLEFPGGFPGDIGLFLRWDD
jgi:CBS domain-containing protein/uncharacterized membrane protein